MVVALTSAVRAGAVFTFSALPLTSFAFIGVFILSIPFFHLEIPLCRDYYVSPKKRALS
jgi:hypothetical protein